MPLLMKTLNYRIRLEKEEQSGYTVIVPALAGCVTFGETDLRKGTLHAILKDADLSLEELQDLL
jgi:hypothetical protein